MKLVKQARLFAIAAHTAVEQFRKYTGEPYHVHPGEVAHIVERFGGTEEQIAAAWLHDVVEDTGVTIEVINTEFGPEVAELVGWLTDVSLPHMGNRAERKAIDREHTAMAIPEAKFIKAADLISNTRSIVEHDAAFAKVYLEEKRLLIEEAFADMGTEGIMAELIKQLEWGQAQLAKME
ncbi:MAG: HD domain-containing protein [Actinobacteria bacterium]|nr:HD domain-containing protein [Actinomycetota bacterium]